MMRKPRVIIYDDETVILDMLEQFFAGRGYEAYGYNSPKVCPINEGLADRCDDFYPCADLLISDFNMPHMTGIELLLRQLKRGCKIDVKMKALMSGYATQQLTDQCDALGCRFFQKPFPMSELSDWLAECESHFDLSQPLSDRRTSKRHEFQNDIEYCLHSAVSKERFLGITFDKSTDGLGVRIFNPLRRGERILLADGPEAPQRLGIIMWCSKRGENTYRAGLRLM